MTFVYFVASARFLADVVLGGFGRAMWTRLRMTNDYMMTLLPRRPAGF